MKFRLLVLVGLFFTGSLLAQNSGVLSGRLEGNTYHPPTDAYSIRIPVLPELGGQIKDTDNVVTFQDSFNVHVSIAAFSQDATQRWELSTRGLNEYLSYFLENFVLPDFYNAFPGTVVESSAPVKSIEGGALLAFTLLPGGSMFAERASMPLDGSLPIAKRGNLIFLKNGFIYVISMELTERVIEGGSYKLKTADEDRLLRERIEAILDRMEFKPAAKTH